MNTTLSQKDKKVLFFVVLIIFVIACLKFFIMPTYDKIEKAKSDNKILIEKQEKMENEINKIESYKHELKTVDKEYKNSANKVFCDFEVYDIDKSLTQIVQDSQLVSILFEPSEKNAVKVIPFNPKNEDEPGGVEADEKSNIFAQTVDIAAEGPAENIIKLINTLDSQSGIFIQDCDVSLKGPDSSVKATLALILGEEKK